MNITDFRLCSNEQVNKILQSKINISLVYINDYDDSMI